MMHIEMIGVVSGCGPWFVDAANGSDEVYMWYVALSDNIGMTESKVWLNYRHHHFWYEYRNNRGQGRV